MTIYLRPQITEQRNSCALKLYCRDKTCSPNPAAPNDIIRPQHPSPKPQEALESGLGHLERGSSVLSLAGTVYETVATWLLTPIVRRSWEGGRSPVPNRSEPQFPDPHCGHHLKKFDPQAREKKSRKHLRRRPSWSARHPCGSA